MTITSDGADVAVAVGGDVDLANVDGLQQRLEAAIPNQVTSVTIDLTDVTYIDSIGMRLLFSLAARLQTAQIAVVVVAPTGSPARRVIEISGLAAVVTLDPAR
jgi:anti-anti-sigma factor